MKYKTSELVHHCVRNINKERTHYFNKIIIFESYNAQYIPCELIKFLYTEISHMGNLDVNITGLKCVDTFIVDSRAKKTKIP